MNPRLTIPVVLVIVSTFYGSPVLCDVDQLNMELIVNPILLRNVNVPDDIVLDRMLKGDGESTMVYAFRKGVSSNEKVINIIAALRNYIAKNSSDEGDHEKVHYINIIPKCCADSRETVGKLFDDASGELRQWLLIARGQMGDIATAEALLVQAIKSDNYSVKRESLMALTTSGLLNALKKEDIIRAGRVLLKDEKCFKKNSRSDAKDAPWVTGLHCPVRGAAYTLLKKIGVKLECNKKLQQCNIIE